MLPKQEWLCCDTDLIEHGISLGYEWARVCDLMDDNYIKGMGSTGYCIIHHSSIGNGEHCTENCEDMAKIIDTYLEAVNITTCIVVNT